MFIQLQWSNIFLGKRKETRDSYDNRTNVAVEGTKNYS